MSIKLATHKHFRITGLYRHSMKWTPWQTGVEFYCESTNKWLKSSATFRADLIELTAEEKAAL